MAIRQDMKAGLIAVLNKIVCFGSRNEESKGRSRANHAHDEIRCSLETNSLRVFHCLASEDPTTLNQQGNDFGTQYRSGWRGTGTDSGCSFETTGWSGPCSIEFYLTASQLYPTLSKRPCRQQKVLSPSQDVAACRYLWFVDAEGNVTPESSLTWKKSSLLQGNPTLVKWGSAWFILQFQFRLAITSFHALKPLEAKLLFHGLKKAWTELAKVFF